MAGEERVDWSPSQEYKGSAYERDYWGADPASAYFQSRLQQLQQEAGQRGQEVTAQVEQETGGQGAGSIGQFAKAVRADQPYAQARAGLEQEDIQRRWGAEQQQTGRQADWRTSTTQMDLQRALAEQGSRMDKWRQRKTAEQAAQTSGRQLIGTLGTAVGTVMGGPVGGAIGKKITGG